MSIWDDPEVVPPNNFMKFDNPGDKVSGVITAIDKQRFVDDKGNVNHAPVLRLTTDGGEDITVTCGQIRLKMALAEQRPEVGDHIAITFERSERRAAGKTLKHFAVVVTRAVPANSTDEPPF